MHKMEQTPKIVTIIGLALEGLGAVGMFVGGFIFRNVFTEEFFTQLDPNIDMSEVQMILDIYGVMGSVFIVLGIVLLLALILNLYLFIGLMNGRYSQESARKVYTWQLIWGIISIFSNTLTGILYIISAVQGRNGQKDRIPTREGI